ncbi:hypothetical protein Lrub_2091 [Legionella rubrilucens]|uniref:VirK protein n=1 Tax=Legionella rubrilucens TaxID=458 RepID=A0A0W0XR45_9GAMM|nr:hypothetical protein [Legionella rubrilucens]KTD47169.1 hypothetical protein Lrub_2091 [Legionella rubrilucens]
MKKLLFLLLLVTSLSGEAAPEQGRVQLQLTTIERDNQCPSFLHNADVVVDYDYDFSRNRGLAYLRQLKSEKVNYTLHPLGLSSYYAFMSDISPTTQPIGDEKVIVYRIIFHIYKPFKTRVMLMLGEQGECIMSSEVTA